MPVVTIYRLSEEIKSLLDGGASPAASSISYDEIKIAIGQMANSLLKVEHFQVNMKMNEMIPNGSVLGWYEDIEVVSYNGKCKATLPIKPLKLPRNMGIFAIYPKYDQIGSYELDKEFIPVQMGQMGLLKSQPLINDLLGQVCYEAVGNMDIIINKNLPSIYPYVRLAMKLAIMDITQYGDYDPLPILPEQEWKIKQEVWKMYSQQPIPDKLVDPTIKENVGMPPKQQRES